MKEKYYECLFTGEGLETFAKTEREAIENYIRMSDWESFVQLEEILDYITSFRRMTLREISELEEK